MFLKRSRFRKRALLSLHALCQSELRWTIGLMIRILVVVGQFCTVVIHTQMYIMFMVLFNTIQISSRYLFLWNLHCFLKTNYSVFYSNIIIFHIESEHNNSFGQNLPSLWYLSLIGENCVTSFAPEHKPDLWFSGMFHHILEPESFLLLQKQQAELEKELEALQNNADGPPKVEICPPSPGGDAKMKWVTPHCLMRNRDSMFILTDFKRLLECGDVSTNNDNSSKQQEW